MNSNFFKSVNLIYYALLGGQLLFCLAAIAITMGQGGPAGAGSNLYFLIAPFISVSTIIIAVVFNNFRKQQAKDIRGLELQKEHYSISVLIRAAILEAGSLFVIVMLFLDGGNFYYLVFFALSVGAFLLLRPSLREMRDVYELSRDELDQL